MTPRSVRLVAARRRSLLVTDDGRVLAGAFDRGSRMRRTLGVRSDGRRPRQEAHPGAEAGVARAAPGQTGPGNAKSLHL